MSIINHAHEVMANIVGEALNYHEYMADSNKCTYSLAQLNLVLGYLMSTVQDKICVCL